MVPDGEVRFDPVGKPGVSNLLSILGAITGCSPEDLAEDYTQRELAEAMAALMVAGRMRNAVVGQYANRSPKKGLVEVEI